MKRKGPNASCCENMFSEYDSSEWSLSPQKQQRQRRRRHAPPDAVDANNCFETVTRDVIVPLYPWQLGQDAGTLVAEHLRCQLHRYVSSLEGILHSISSVHLLAGTAAGAAAAGRHRLAALHVSSGPSLVQFPVHVRLACRLFRPRTGAELVCRVTAALPDLLSCVCHGVYQVTVTAPPPMAPTALAPGDRVLARVVRVRTHSRQQVSIEAEFVRQLSAME